MWLPIPVARLVLAIVCSIASIWLIGVTAFRLHSEKRVRSDYKPKGDFRQLAGERARHILLSKLTLFTLTLVTCIISIPLAFEARPYECMVLSRTFALVTFISKESLYLFLALKSSLTRITQEPTMLEKMTISNILFSCLCAPLITYYAAGDVIEMNCITTELTPVIVPAFFTYTFYTSALLYLFAHPLLEHMKRMERQDESLKRTLKKNLFLCLAAIVSTWISMIYLFLIPFVPSAIFGALFTTICNLDQVFCAYVVHEQSKKRKHDGQNSNDSRTTQKEPLKKADSGETGLQNSPSREREPTTVSILRTSEHNPDAGQQLELSVLPCGQETPMTPTKENTLWGEKLDLPIPKNKYEELPLTPATPAPLLDSEKTWGLTTVKRDSGEILSASGHPGQGDAEVGKMIFNPLFTSNLDDNV